MTIHRVSRCDQLFRTLDKCQGEVTLQTSDGKSCRWGEESEALAFLAAAFGTGTCERLQVFCEDSRDVRSIMDYLAGCERAS